MRFPSRAIVDIQRTLYTRYGLKGKLKEFFDVREQCHYLVFYPKDSIQTFTIAFNSFEEVIPEFQAHYPELFI